MEGFSLSWSIPTDRDRVLNTHSANDTMKVGEVWDEISREFEAAGLRPVTPDKEALSTIHGITEDKARRVAAEQTSILERGEKEDVKEEHVMYAEVLAVSLRPISAAEGFTCWRPAGEELLQPSRVCMGTPGNFKL
ncbi:unnamed protein product [Lampetra planeri]